MKLSQMPRSSGQTMKMIIPSAAGAMNSNAVFVSSRRRRAAVAPDPAPDDPEDPDEPELPAGPEIPEAPVVVVDIIVPFAGPSRAW